MDTDREENKPRMVPHPKGAANGTGRVETKFHLVTRCNNCAAEIQVTDQVQATDRCRHCNTDLHTCRNCLNFDPSARNECIKPVGIRVSSKNLNNFCPFFEAKILIEKQGSGAPPPTHRVADPHRQAFLDLFK